MKNLLSALCVLLLSCFAVPASAKPTTVPGHTDRWDPDGNGILDEGVTVNGHYTAVYAYDGDDDWYWDLGDGRVLGTVGSIGDLDPATLTICNYVINYRETSRTIRSSTAAGFRTTSSVPAMTTTTITTT